MSTRKIVITVFAVLLIPAVILAVMFEIGFMIEDGFFENYSGWKDVEIPTETETRATIKLPENWNFVVENGRIKIKDSDENVIAVECFEDWQYDYYNGDNRYTNNDKIDINSELSEPYRNLDNYKFMFSTGAPISLHEIIVDSISTYALKFEIMGSVSKDCTYKLFLVFDSNINDIDFFDKMQKSYRWAGWIDE